MDTDTESGAAAAAREVEFDAVEEGGGAAAGGVAVPSLVAGLPLGLEDVEVVDARRGMPGDGPGTPPGAGVPSSVLALPESALDADPDRKRPRVTPEPAPALTGDLLLEELEQAKRLCSALADLEVELRRSRLVDADRHHGLAARKRTLRAQLRALESRVRGSDSAPGTLVGDFICYTLQASQPAYQMTDLLDDELMLILSCVPLLNGSPKHLLALGAVSRRFKDLVHQPAVWRDLVLKPHSETLTDAKLLSLIRRNAGGEPTFSRLCALSLQNCKWVSSKTVSKTLQVAGAQLTRLDVSGCSLVTTETARLATEICPKLEWVSFNGCGLVDTTEMLTLVTDPATWPNLKTIDLAGTSVLTARVARVAFEEAVSQLQALREARPEVSLHNLQQYLTECVAHLEDWDRQPVSSCIVCGVMHNPLPDSSLSNLSLLPGCGHVMCLACEHMSRRQMTKRVTPQRVVEYAYPCPLCGNDMPLPGGFEISV